MLYSRRGRPTDVPRNSSKMLSPRRMSVASVPFVAASRASSDANRRHPSGVPSTGAGGSTSTCAGTRCRSRAHASGEARRRRGLRGAGRTTSDVEAGEASSGEAPSGDASRRPRAGSFDATSANITAHRTAETVAHRHTRRLSAGFPPRGGRGSVSSATSPSRVHRLRAGRATGAALDASSAREDADVSRAYPSAPPRGRTISMDAITNRRTTPASRARVVVDAGRDGGRLDDARISLASRAATSKRAMRENYLRIRRASLDRRRSRRSRRDFGGGGRCERPARLARRRRLSARVFASHFKPGAPPRPRERSTATVARAIPSPLPLPLMTRAVDASPPSPPRRGSSPPSVSVSTFFPSSFIVAPVLTAAVGSRLRSCRAFAARLVRARSRVAPTPRARRVARTRA